MESNARRSGRLLRVCVLGSALVLAACNSHSKWTYPADAGQLYRSSASSADLTVAVLPFEEERPSRNRGATLFLYLVPLMPFGWMTYERPDAARTFLTIQEYEFDASEDLAHAAVRSLKKSGVFKRVYFTYGGDVDNADYVLTGRVTKTRYKGRMFTYGLSVYGPLLWLVGLPAGTSENSLSVELELRDPRDEVVWRSRSDASKSLVQGLYYNMGSDTVNFAVLMQDAMNSALQGLDGDQDALLEHRDRLAEDSVADAEAAGAR